MANEAAQQISPDSSDNVNEKISRGAVHFLNLRTHVHQYPHVESDVQNAAVKKCSHDQSPRLEQISRRWQRRAENCQHPAVDRAETHQRRKSSASRRLKSASANRSEQAHSIEQATQSQDSVRRRRSGRQQAAERPASSGHTKRQACAALMAFRGSRADERAASGTQLRARIFFRAATKETAHLFLETIQLPTQARRDIQ